MNTSPLIILFEPRLLLRNGFSTLLRERGLEVVTPLSMEQLTEELCLPADNGKVVLVGAGGLGADFFRFVRTLHFTRTQDLKTVVYLPEPDELMTRLFIAAGASQCMTAKSLESELDALLDIPPSMLRNRAWFSPSELNILLDYAAGMDTRDIAGRRNCCIKTVFTFKNNARVRLGLNNRAEWITLLSHISQFAEKYK